MIYTYHWNQLIVKDGELKRKQNHILALSFINNLLSYQFIKITELGPRERIIPLIPCITFSKYITITSKGWLSDF